MQRDYSRLNSWLPVLAENTISGGALEEDPQVITKLQEYNLWAQNNDVDPLLANSPEFQEFLDDLTNDLPPNTIPTATDVVQAIDRLMS